MKLTHITYLSILTIGFFSLKAPQSAQAQQAPIQSDQLPPSVVDAAQDLANSLGQDLDTVLKNNPSFAKKAASTTNPEFFIRINNLIQNADNANSITQDGNNTPNTVDGIRRSLEMNPINNNNPVPADQTNTTSGNTNPVTNPQTPATTATPTPNTTSEVTSSPETTPEEIPVKTIPLGNLTQ